MVGVGGTGWLLGPFVGEGVFRAVYRREWGLMSVVCSVPLFQSFFPFIRLFGGREKGSRMR